MRIVFIAVTLFVTLTYPLVVYFGLQRFSPALFSLLFMGLAALKLLMSKNDRNPSLLITLFAITLYSICLAVFNSEHLLKLYPVFVSFSVASLFFASLFQSESLIERAARQRGKVISARAKYYTRNLTCIWAIILLVNGCISLYLALNGTRAAWALYCGLICYFCFAVFFAVEYAYRLHFIAKANQ